MLTIWHAYHSGAKDGKTHQNYENQCNIICNQCKSNYFAFKFIDLDNKDDRIFGIASGSMYPFPDRDDQHTQRLDNAYLEEKRWAAEEKQNAKEDKAKQFTRQSSLLWLELVYDLTTINS